MEFKIVTNIISDTSLTKNDRNIFYKAILDAIIDNIKSYDKLLNITYNVVNRKRKSERWGDSILETYDFVSTFVVAVSDNIVDMNHLKLKNPDIYKNVFLDTTFMEKICDKIDLVLEDNFNITHKSFFMPSLSHLDHLEKK